MPESRRSSGYGPSPAYPLLVVLAALFVAGACGGGAGRRSARSPNLAEPCGVDQTREFFCDDLVPSTGVPAPSPYEACPWTIDYATGDYDPPPTIAVFDAAHTEYLRKRAPPGHACCYSFCSKLQVKPESAVSDQEDCRTNAAFREEYCIAEPEGGTTESAPGYGRCPAALTPPQKRVFSAPKAALLDATLTASRRGSGEALCCYAWCSQSPPGSGLEHRVQPNTK